MENKPHQQLPRLMELMMPGVPDLEPGKIMIQEGSPYFQTPSRVDQFVRHKSDLCYYLAMPFVHQDQLPHHHDVVIHFRDFELGRRRRRMQEGQQPLPHFYTMAGETPWLTIPPTVYFTRLLEAHSYKTIWLVAEPAARQGPAIQHILTKFDNAVLRDNTSPEQDFQFLSFASHIILSPSTFGWWAAFFANNSATIHLPIMPAHVVLPWCDLLSGFSNAIFHDWYHNLTTVDLRQAQKICYQYHAKPETLDLVSAFYPEMNCCAPG